MRDNSPNQNIDASTTDVFEAAPFAVIRTPLHPFDRFARWSSNTPSNAINSVQDYLSATEALRRGLRRETQDKHFHWALEHAAPELARSLRYWDKSPESKRGVQAERSLIRYFARACSRCTPFGGLAGWSIGTVSVGKCALSLAPITEYRIFSRLGWGALWALTMSLTESMSKDLEARYFTNTSLDKVGGSINLFALERLTSYTRLRLKTDAALDRVTDLAQYGASRKELRACLQGLFSFGDLSGSDADEYIQALADAWILLAEYVPSPIGFPPVKRLEEALRSFEHSARNPLETVEAVIASVDRNYPDKQHEHNDELTQALQAAGVLASSARTHTRLFKPLKDGILPTSVTSDVIAGLEILSAMGANPRNTMRKLVGFRKRFQDRYGASRWVSLPEVLDERVGIGLDPDVPPRDSPLLSGTIRRNDQTRTAFTTFEMKLLEKLSSHLTRDPMVLDPAEFPLLRTEQNSLPDAFAMLATLIAPSSTAVMEGEYMVHLKAGAGPSGAVLLARLASESADLTSLLKVHALQEEALLPEAIFAEVNFIPPSAAGDILTRPQLRSYEILCGGLSTLSPEFQIRLDELLVTVTADGQILLYSLRLARRILPRISSAHDFDNLSLPASYRFLAYLQYEPWLAVPQFQWGPLSALPYLPRVVVGRVLLSLATWQLSEQEILALRRQKGNRHGLFLAVQQIRERRALPRWVCLVEGDTGLTTDLDNPLSVDAFVQVLQRKLTATLQEVPEMNQRCARGPEGAFSNEMIIPLCRKAASPSILRHELPPVHPSLQQGRTHAPGGDWIYVKLYGTHSLLDEVIYRVLNDVFCSLKTRGIVESWFFIRFADPETHLRIRFKRASGISGEEIVASLRHALREQIGSDADFRLDISTYQQEIERYGGVEGLGIAEQVFMADSTAVCLLLGELQLTEAPIQRWQLAVISIDRLLDDFVPDVGERIVLLQSVDDYLRGEVFVPRRMSEETLEAQRSLPRLLAEYMCSPGGQRIKALLDQRSARNHHNRKALEAVRLSVPMVSLVTSFVHMHMNRLMEGENRLHEFATCRSLKRLYESRLARASYEAKE